MCIFPQNGLSLQKQNSFRYSECRCFKGPLRYLFCFLIPFFLIKSFLPGQRVVFSSQKDSKLFLIAIFALTARFLFDRNSYFGRKSFVWPRTLYFFNTFPSIIFVKICFCLQDFRVLNEDFNSSVIASAKISFFLLYCQHELLFTFWELYY